MTPSVTPVVFLVYTSLDILVFSSFPNNAVVFPSFSLSLLYERVIVSSTNQTDLRWSTSILNTQAGILYSFQNVLPI